MQRSRDARLMGRRGFGKGGGYLLSRFRSIIGVMRFNFSVRNGKRWNPHAIYHLNSLKKRDSSYWLNTEKHTNTLFLLHQKGFGWLVSLGYRPHSPCTCDLSTSSSLTTLYGNLILRGASCLDAFSTYPCQTRLPGGAPGGTTDTPEVCPTRSSRTSVGSSQISCAHNR